MTARAVAVVVLVLAGGCAGVRAERASPWQRVGFLIGCWQQRAADAVTIEVWTEPHGDVMYGQSRTLRGGQLRAFELLAIERRGDDLVYVARPGGRGATEFALSANAPGDVTFANSQHDFPRRIRYVAPAPDRLTAVVDDGSDGGQRLELAFDRVN